MFIILGKDLQWQNLHLEWSKIWYAYMISVLNEIKVGFQINHNWFKWTKLEQNVILFIIKEKKKIF